ncbi:MAG: HAD family hydrolase [Acidobacteria bacterium]|nr:HAD family hydrolase [Acidobacteriota bacterium]
MKIKGLFFDVGNTLLFPNRRRILASLHERQVFPSEELLQAIERRTKREFDALVESHTAVDYGFWQIFYAHLLEELGIAGDGICADLVARTRISANWCDLRPGTREVLLEFGKNYRLGVISNADGRIAEILAQCGIADCFETILDSGVVGAEKPTAAIFEAAVDSLGVTPRESLYVGDVYSVDYLGAAGIGMRSVLFDVVGAYIGSGLPRVESLQELAEQLRFA